MTALPAEPLTPMVEPPSNIDLEQAVLGALLVNNGTIDRIGNLEPDHFFEPIHHEIFTAIRDLLHAGKTVTPLSLKAKFEVVEISPNLTGAQYLGRLAVNATSTQNVKAYADEIIKLCKLRQLRELAHDLNYKVVVERDSDPKEVIEELERRAYEIAQGDSTTQDTITFSNALSQVMQSVEAAQSRATGLAGLSSGFRKIDDVLTGFAKSDLIILAGRPSIGKTALGLNIAYNVASMHRPDNEDRNTGGPVGFFSLEMSAEQLAQRIVSDLSNVTVSRMRAGRLGNEDMETLRLVVRDGGELPLFIDQTGGLTIGQLALRARRWKRRYGIKLIVVDYLQLMTGDKKSFGRVEEVSQITVGLKALAKELQIPIIALSQLSRQVEQRDDKRPIMSDLRESGSIEQDADVILFVYREAYYLEKRKPDKISQPDRYMQWQTDMEAIKNKAEVIIGKNRHGPCKTLDMEFEARTTRFRDGGHAHA